MKSIARLIIILFCSSLILPFQNCSAYKSEGRDVYESALVQAENRGCYPYIDTNIAMGFIGVTSDSLFIYKEKVPGEDAYICDFIMVDGLTSHISCKVSEGNAELALALAEQGTEAFPDITGVWGASAPSLFLGERFGGYWTDDADDMRTISFLAAETNDQKGVNCSVRMNKALHAANTSTVHARLSRIAFEMAIRNVE